MLLVLCYRNLSIIELPFSHFVSRSRILLESIKLRGITKKKIYIYIYMNIVVHRFCCGRNKVESANKLSNYKFFPKRNAWIFINTVTSKQILYVVEKKKTTIVRLFFCALAYAPACYTSSKRSAARNLCELFGYEVYCVIPSVHWSIRTSITHKVIPKQD